MSKQGTDSCALSAKQVVNDADAARIIWARVKGYPWWPAQILSKAAARQHLGGVTHKSKSDAPVIFFGTSEIAWIGAKDVTCWETGMAQSFHNKGRKNKKFVVALEQVRDFLTLTSERVAPPGWWCPPPARGARAATEEPVSDDEHDLQLQQQQAAGAAPGKQPAAAFLQDEPLQEQLAQAAEQQGSFASGGEVQACNGGGGGGGGGSFTAAAVAAALSAEEAADLQQAAATAAAVMHRSINGLNRHSSGRVVDDSALQHNSLSSRSAGTHKSACQQIWGGGGGSMTGNPSLDGTAEQEPLGRHQRKRRATRLLYDTASEASESEGSENAAAAAAAAQARPAGAGGRGAGKRNGSRSRGTSAVAAAAAAAAAVSAAEEAEPDYAPPPSFLAAKKRRLLQAEGDAGGSDSEATDMESLAMAALAMAQLASGGSWDQQDAAAPAAALDNPAPPAAAMDVDVGGDEVGSAGGVAGLHCKVEEAAAPAEVEEAAQQIDNTALLTAHYVHGGHGLKCSHSWQYAVAMPAAAAGPGAAAQPEGGSGSSSSADKGCEAPSEAAAVAAVPAVAACPGSAYYVQLFAGFAGCALEELDGQLPGAGDDDSAGVELQEQQGVVAPVDGLAVVAEAAAAAAAAELVGAADAGGEPLGHAGLEALAAAAGETVGAAAGAHYGAAHPLFASAVAADLVAARAVAGFGMADSTQQRSSAELQQHIAAANAAICAAFTTSAAAAALGHAVPRHHHHHHHHHQLQHGMQHHSSSAAVSDRSAGSAGQRYGVTGSISSKRRNAAAAAAALAAAHVLTPPNPTLDAEVANLLLQPEGPVLPLQAGLPDVGFRLPRELLLNRAPKFEWLKRNIYVSRERPKRLAKQEVHVCCCRPRRVQQADGSEMLVGCTDGCLNRLSFIHCDPRTCPCGAACTNKPFHLLKALPLEVFLTENRGHGVRLTQQLEKGQFVVEYAGEVIDQAELQRRMDAARDSGEQHFYIMELAPGLYIDAKRKGNHARLLNSSCEPNCETQKWRDAATGEVRIGIFTTRPVLELEELTYDYMFEHSGVGALARGFKCMCGARNCRGTMDYNPDRKRDWGRRLEVFWEGDGVYYRGTVTGYSTSSGKHTIMYDDGDVERVRLTEVPHRWLDGDASPHSSAQAAAGSPAGRAVPAAAAAAAGDSGSWSQTDQEAAVDDSTGPSGLAAAAAAGAGMSIGVRMGRPALGASPLRPAGGAAAAAAAAPAAGDDAVAADALVTLGLAAEAELEQQQHQQPLPKLLPHGHGDADAFARPPAKRHRMGGYPQAEQARYDAVLQQQHQQQQQHQGVHLARPQQQWQHSSSSSQSAGGHFGIGGAVDGHSPISPPGQRGPQQAYRPPSSLGLGAAGMGVMDAGWGAAPPNHQAGPHYQQQQQQRGAIQQQQHQQRRSAGGAELDTPGEFLPWEQLLSGIRAIKSQGPPLFQKSTTAAAVPGAHRQQQQHPGVPAKSSHHRGAPHGTCASKFGRLLDLVGQVQPNGNNNSNAPSAQQQQQPQQQQQQQAQQQQQPPQQPPMPMQRLPLAQAGRSGSWAGSSSASNGSCQLPLFRMVGSQVSTMLLQQHQQQQQQSLQPQQPLLMSPRSRHSQQQAQQQMPPPAQWPQLPPVHPHHQQQQQQQGLPAAAVAAKGPQHAAADGGQGTAPASQAVEPASTAASFTRPQPPLVAPEQRQQQQPVPDCVRCGLPDADSRASATTTAAAAATAVQGCCVGQAVVLGSAGSGSSTASADSALAASAVAVPALQPAAGIVDMRQAQAVAQ